MIPANVDLARQSSSSVVIVRENNAVEEKCNGSATRTASFVNVC